VHEGLQLLAASTALLIYQPGVWCPVYVQAAYNWALACYLHHGEDHPETWAAHEAMEEADPQCWVPGLLAGLSYPPLSMAPVAVPGSKMEAVVG
jgi:hypothetical protein